MPRGTYVERSSASSAAMEWWRTVTRPFKQIRSGTCGGRPRRCREAVAGARREGGRARRRITNRNFKVEVEGGVFVLRMGGARTELLGIDRAVEYAAGKRAFEVGVGPEVTAFAPDEGWLVARFVDGRPMTLEEMRQPETLGRVAGALRTFHEAAPIPGRFDAWTVVDDYRAAAEAHQVAIPSQFTAAREIAERIRSARGPQSLVPCHNDLLNANFLDDGLVRIVDWEY